jgi:hypothetical protein
MVQKTLIVRAQRLSICAVPRIDQRRPTSVYESSLPNGFSISMPFTYQSASMVVTVRTSCVRFELSCVSPRPLAHEACSVMSELRTLAHEVRGLMREG